MMKIKSTIVLLIAILFVTFNSQAQQKEPFTIKFVTLGNCYTCKLRIEAKVNSLEGVSSSIYDPSKAETTVTYDDLITDAYIIMQAVADTGHDTEWFRAPDAAYNLLIGTCCEYERTIDYNEAQVGYLTLMDLWMGHVAIDELYQETTVSVYPNIGHGIYNISLQDFPFMISPDLQVYSMSGNLVYTQKLQSHSNEQIDLSNMPNGNYIMVLSHDHQMISKTKIIKN